MQYNNFVEHTPQKKKYKGTVLGVLSIIFTIVALICALLCVTLVHEHFELQKNAEDFEGLGSIGIIIAVIVYALICAFCSTLSIIFYCT